MRRGPRMRCRKGRGRHGARAWRVGEGASAATASSPSSSAVVVSSPITPPCPHQRPRVLALLFPSIFTIIIITNTLRPPSHQRHHRYQTTAVSRLSLHNTSRHQVDGRTRAVNLPCPPHLDHQRNIIASTSLSSSRPVYERRKVK